jgi:hypothetical protein
MKAKLAFPIDNPANDIKTLDPKLTLKELDEAKQIVGGQKDDPDDDATEQMTTYEAAQAELTGLADAVEGR